MTDFEPRGGGEAPSVRTFLFGPVVVRVLGREGVWEITPHGQALGEGMAEARPALIGQSVLEVGVGCGVHAAAALKLGARRVDVTDIDPQALELAEENARLNGVSYRRLGCYDWLDFDPPEPYDTLICNPPFCKADRPDRRYFIRELIRRSPRFLRRGGHLLFVQSGMADFARTEGELREAGYHFEIPHEARRLFRDYYFTEPGFIEEARKVRGGFEIIEDAYVETLRVYWATNREMAPRGQPA